VVLIAGGVYAAVQGSGDPDSIPPIDTPTSVTPTQTSTEPPSWAGGEIEAGTYRLYVGQHPDLSSIEADMTFLTDGWSGSDLPVVENDDEEYGGAGVQQPERLPGRADHCFGTVPHDDWDAASQEPASTSRALAQQFAELPSTQLVQPVTRTQAFGHEAFHLRIQVNDNCGERGGYPVFTSSLGLMAVSYRDQSDDLFRTLVDLLVVDLDGTPVVAYYWYEKGADPALVAEVTGVRDSITFVPATQ